MANIPAVGINDISTELTLNVISSGKVYKINSIIISNIDGTNNADISIALYRNAVAYYLASTVVVSADSTLILVSKDMGIYLEEGDSIRCFSSAAGVLQAICSYEEIS